MTAARSFTLLLSLPLAIVIGAFFLMPMGELFLRSFFNREGGST